MTGPFGVALGTLDKFCSVHESIFVLKGTTPGLLHGRELSVYRSSDASVFVRDVDGVEEDRRGTVSIFNGPDPEIVKYPSADDEVKAIGRAIYDAIDDGIPPEEISVFVRSEAVCIGMQYQPACVQVLR